MKFFFLLLTYLFVPVLIFAQANIPAIPGWSMENINGRYKFTPPAGNFEYDVLPVEKTEVNDLTEWVKVLSSKDLPASGYSAPLASPRPIAKYVKEAYTYTVMVTDQQNTQWGVMYVVYKRPDNTIRSGKVVWMPGKPNPSLQTAAAHFAALMKEETGKMSEKSSTSVSAGKRPETKSSATDSRPSSPVTAPGKGLAAADIRGIVLHSESSIGVGGMMIIVWRPYVLLKNGTMYEHPEVSPYDLDVARSKQQEPEKWGTWKINGKILTVNRGSKTGVESKADVWKNGWWAWANPAAPNEKLNASYYSLSGGGNTAMGGGSITVSSTNLTFNSNGQFTYASTGGGSYSGPSGSVTAFADKNKAGTYKLDGFSLELTFNNGTVTRQCFYFMGNDKTTFGIANRSYILSDGK